MTEQAAEQTYERVTFALILTQQKEIERQAKEIRRLEDRLHQANRELTTSVTFNPRTNEISTTSHFQLELPQVYQTPATHRMQVAAAFSAANAAGGAA